MSQIYIFQVPPKTNARGKPIGERKYQLATFNTYITSKVLPLAYSFTRLNDDNLNTLPNASKICDLKDCTASSSEEATCLSRFHTIHLCCYQIANNQCPICTKPLLDEMKGLSHSFNESLLEPTKNHLLQQLPQIKTLIKIMKRNWPSVVPVKHMCTINQVLGNRKSIRH